MPGAPDMDISMARQQSVDHVALARELEEAVTGEVRFDTGSRALYSTDASNYRQVPIGVVVPRSVDDIERAIRVCRTYGVPVLNRGGGTSLAGQACNAAVVIDSSKYLRDVLGVDPERRLARVQPGVVLDDLRHEAERYHLTFGPDPATHNHCTLGGMIGNDSCGVHSVMAGRTADNVESLEILTYDGARLRVGRTSEDELERIIGEGGRRGEIYAQLKALRDRYAGLIRERYPHIPRRVSGYTLEKLLPEHGFNIAQALVGSESTCVTILEAEVNLIHSPSARVLVVLGYPDLYQACDHVPEIMRYQPTGLEGFDDRLVEDMRRKGLHVQNLPLLPEGGGWLLVEFGADTQREALDQAHSFTGDVGRYGKPSVRLFADVEQAEKIWKIRESGLGAAAVIPGRPQAWPGWEDSAAPPERFGEYLRDLRALMDRYGYSGDFYGHFGQGCLHTRMDFDFTSQDGIRLFRDFVEHAADLVVSYGGSLSGEHGDGQARAELLGKMYGPELVRAFQEFKAIWDPEGKMNPGKVVDPYRIDENLRLGTGYHPRQVQTQFQYPDDGGSFAKAALRCVGVGRCRRETGGTMCPSYMVTHEEKHSTRGRARLLFEMMRGDTIQDGWKSESVKDALDLCLACKGCKGDCPVNVDMATYKAEFLSHYYEGRMRPVSAYSMGLIYWWARLASLAPGLVNAAARAPLLSQAAKRIGGIAPERSLPRFAEQTFVSWFRSRAPRNVNGPQVLLWPDTFNNHFHAETARAAVDVLESAGYQVIIPHRSLCCGRPLYDFGMLDTAKRLLRDVLDTLRPHLDAGMPVVGLEPSCVSVFRDELCNLFPDDPVAQRMARQTVLLSEFIEQNASRFDLPPLHEKAIVQIHCHHKAVLGTSAEESLFKRLELDANVLDSGCCGMAGAFGFERQGDHYDVSIACGERVLLPAVRTSPSKTLVVADGFSCREQISQTTERETLHTAQLVQRALRESGRLAPPERSITTQNRRETIGRIALVTAVAGGIAAVAGIVRNWRRRT